MRPSLLQRLRIATPEHWRPGDRLLAQWVLARGGGEALARWAGALSAAEGEGHTALALDGDALGDVTLDLGALDASPWVGDGTARTPFVRDGNARLYLWRYWQAEHAVASGLAALAREAPTFATAFNQRIDDSAIDLLFGGPGDGRDAAQREAVRRCASSRLFVLTGGPGTGKTSTVLRMLTACERAQGHALRVRVAAPTGKAAQRLGDALRVGGASAPETSTVHRLLGYQPTRQRYARDATNPIDAELVVIDEASMLDLETLAALLDALPPTAALWLLGDADQLSPIGPGSALQDLVQALEAQADAHRALPLVRLTHSFRANADLQAINAALRRGDALEALALAAPKTLPDSSTLDDALRRWAGGLAAESRFAALPAGADAAREAAGDALASLRARQWLCATREGARGAETVNARLDALLRRHTRRVGAATGRANAGAANDVDRDGAHYPGRRLLITRNDPDTGLFNGDVGVVLADADGRLRAWFDGDDGARALPLGLLPAHTPAFALTVHKSQGSEYGHVAVLLPDDPTHRVLSRELLYTAASRARTRLDLHASSEVIDAALARPVRRMGGLHARLAEALASR